MTQWPTDIDDAERELLQWSHSASVMQARIFDKSAGQLTRRGDVFLFTIAVRQVRRFASLILQIGPEFAHPQISRAIEEFDATSRDVKNVRDVLDHFDDYLRGNGLVFRARSPDEYYFEGLISVRKPMTMWIDPVPGEYRLHISPAPGVTLLLDVNREAIATQTLVGTIQQALRPPNPETAVEIL